MKALRQAILESGIPKWAPRMARLRLGIKHVALFSYEVWVINPVTGVRHSASTWSYTDAQATISMLFSLADARGWDLTTMTGR